MTGRGEGIRGDVRAISIPNVVMGVLRILSTLVNRMEGSSFMAIALIGGYRCLCTTPLQALAVAA